MQAEQILQGNAVRGTNRVLQKLEASVRVHASRIAVSDGHDEWTYAGLWAQVCAVRDRVRDVVAEGGLRVGVYLPNTASYIASYYGLMDANCLPFLIDRASNRVELSVISDTCGVSHFAIEERALRTFPLQDVQRVGELCAGVILVARTAALSAAPDALADTVTCRFTSGSSGIPKCLEFSDTAVVTAAETWAQGTGLTAADKTLCIAAFSNGLAFNTSLLSTFLVGGELHMYTGLMMASRIVDVIHQRDITRFVGFPAIYQHMAALELSGAARPKSLSLAISASAVLDPDVRRRFLDTFGVDVSDYYGIAETGPVTFETDKSFKEGLGRPLPGVDIEIGTSGAIRVKTASFASRYLNHPGVFEGKLDPDGYYRTDDLGVIEHERLYLRGKSGSGANIGGRKVFTSDIKAFIQTMPNVRDCEVFVDKDDGGNDVLHAVIAAQESVTRESVISACRSELASYKAPSRVTFVQDIPRSGVGKTTLSTLLELVERDGVATT